MPENDTKKITVCSLFTNAGLKNRIHTLNDNNFEVIDVSDINDNRLLDKHAIMLIEENELNKIKEHPVPCPVVVITTKGLSVEFHNISIPSGLFLTEYLEDLLLLIFNKNERMCKLEGVLEKLKNESRCSLFK